MIGKAKEELGGLMPVEARPESGDGGVAAAGGRGKTMKIGLGFWGLYLVPSKYRACTQSNDKPSRKFVPYNYITTKKKNKKSINKNRVVIFPPPRYLAFSFIFFLIFIYLFIILLEFF